MSAMVNRLRQGVKVVDAPFEGKLDIWDAEEVMASVATEIERLERVLRNIAEGNLGDDPWQANYARIKEIASAALQTPTSQEPTP